MNQLAQIVNPALPDVIGKGDTTQGAKGVGLLITNILDAMLLIGFILTLVYLITGGFHWITSGGDKANLENARNKIIHAIMGLIIIASAWAVMAVVAQFIGWDITNLPIPIIK